MQPRLWWWGLPILALVWFGINVMRMPALEADLAVRTQKIVAPSNVIANIAGRDAFLRGLVPSEEVSSKVIEGTAATYGVRRVSNALVLPPVAKPFVFSIKRSGDTLALSGALPVESFDRIVKTAQETFPTLKVTSTASLSRGEPANYSVAALGALKHVASLQEADLTLSDMSYSITGVAADVNAYENFEAALQQLPANFKIIREDVRIAKVSPYIWSLQKTSEGYVVSGYAPSTALRQAALEVAASNGRKVLDQQRIAQALPSGLDFKAITTFAVNTLSKFEEGRVILTDKVLSVSGSVRDAQTDQEVTRTLSNTIPGGAIVGDVDIAVGRVSPYTLTATREGRYVTIEGYVPDAKAKSDIALIVRRRFLGEGLQDQTKIAAGAPANFMLGVSSALDQLSRLARGKIELRDATIKITGQALYERARDDILSKVASELPQNWKGSAEIEVRLPDTVIPANECQTGLADLMGRGRISFETGSANIYKDSFGLLDNLVFQLNRCPEAVVNIGGHTDTDGSEEFNIDLSRRRAQSVADYLTNASIDKKRIVVVGYGSAMPLVPNDSEENKARNRRIEFLLK